MKTPTKREIAYLIRIAETRALKQPTSFMGEAETLALFARAQFRARKTFDRRWRESVWGIKILHRGYWKYLGRVDLCGQAFTGTPVWSSGDSCRNPQRLIEDGIYGAVHTDWSFFVVDQFSDG